MGTAQHTSRQHLVSQVLLAEFTAPEPKGGSQQLLPFDLHHPGRVHKRMHPRQCGWFENFVAVDSASVEALWGDVERRVPVAIAAVHAGTPLANPRHAATLRDLIVLHFVRSHHYRDMHTASFERARTRLVAKVTRKYPERLRLEALRESGLHLSGPASLGAFAELLTTSWPYHRRRAALEAVFAGRRLGAPWTLCPSTTDPEQVAEWLTWGSVGMEGVIYKRLSDPYRPAMRGWLKYKPWETTEAIVGAVTGPQRRRARCCSVDTTPPAVCSTSGAPPPWRRPPAIPWQLYCPLPRVNIRGPAGPSQPAEAVARHSTSRSCGPGLVVKVGVEVARDGGGRWRHSARLHRPRPEESPGEVDLFGA
ncbi:DUF4238 domain-containing protein [Streptomyces sp. WAC 05379]|uniref:DUF4238 domain-containing protein n=1 Tax=Streptomyces sp. WAC 05379 TaxID=2203207 RepID=UPI0021ADDB01|nr:DUF4238 domain-containing protein [Streptomyces sp. WAC 05379]